LFEPFANESLRKCVGFRQRVVTQEAEDSGEAIYSWSCPALFPVNDRPLVRSQELRGFLEGEFQLKPALSDVFA
jgi:hypothetical protein